MKTPAAGFVSAMLAAVVLVVGTGWIPGTSASQLLGASAAQPPPASAHSVRSLLDRYCVACHNERRVRRGR